MTLNSIDPVALGERLRIARANAQMTQDAAASHLGLARTTLVAIERGQRRLRPEEAIALAKLYAISVGKLLSPDAVHVDLSAKFRRTDGREEAPENRDAITLLNRLATGAAELEGVLGQPLQTDYPPAVRIMSSQVIQQAEDTAIALRQRLGVGLGPINDLITLFELDLGVRIFCRALPSKISGLYAFDPAIGACILINAVHPKKRRDQTLVHEVGHFSADRSHADIVDEEPVPLSVEERFARRFGAAFMLPAPALRARFDQIAGGGDFNVRELILLAHQCNVSTEAMCRRLEELGLVPSGMWDSLNDRGFNSGFERQVLGDAEPSPRPPLVPPRLAYLAAKAVDDGVLSEGQVAELLVLDIVELREALAPFGGTSAP